MGYCLYILRSLKDGTYYIGHTSDIDSGLQRHNQGRVKYTKGNRPWQLAYLEEYPDRSSAMARDMNLNLSYCDMVNILTH